MPITGVYIHIPYCRQACSYCDFYFSTSGKSRKPFLAALVKHIGSFTEIAPHDYQPFSPIETVYFGGGTPGLLDPDELAAILKALNQHLPIAPNAEITIEANPEDAPRFAAFRHLGVNRLSLGIQSFDEQELRFMNRNHSAEQSQQAFEQARSAGFDNISIDLIYATPSLTQTQWLKTLNRALQLNPEHISAYSLTIEPKTLLAHRLAKQLITPAPDEAFITQFQQLITQTKAAGYRHYELSNFAKPGFYSRHNRAYWQTGIGYIAFGPSAHGYDGNRTRYVNRPNVWHYIDAINANQSPYSTLEILSNKDLVNEYLLTHLRTEDGINTTVLTQTFGYNNPIVIRALSDEQLITVNQDQITLTFTGMLQADAVTARLML